MAKQSNGAALLLLVASVDRNVAELRKLSIEQFDALNLRLADVTLIAHDAVTKDQFILQRKELLLAAEAARMENVAQHAAMIQEQEQFIPKAYIAIGVAVIVFLGVLLTVILNARQIFGG